MKIGTTEEQVDEDDQAVPGQLDEVTEKYQRMVGESKARYDAAHNPPDEVVSIPTTIDAESSLPHSYEPILDYAAIQSTTALPNTDTTNTTTSEPTLESSLMLPTPNTTTEQALTPMEVNTPILPQTDDSDVIVPPPPGKEYEATTRQEIISNRPPQAAANDVPPQSLQEDPGSAAPDAPQATTNDTTSPETTKQETTPPPPPPPQSLCPGLHFYLHKPHTTYPHPVLVPLSPQSTLSTCLQNRLILEYPTVYVLPQPPSELPSDFLLEVEYHKQEKKMIEELDQDERELGVGTLPVNSVTGVSRDDEGDVEDARVLESLKRDLLGLTGGIGE